MELTRLILARAERTEQQNNVKDKTIKVDSKSNKSSGNKKNCCKT